jgi:signal peptidase II
MAEKRRWWAWLLLSAAVIALDQLAKAAMIAALHPGQQRVVTEFFSLVLAFNSGAAFSLFRGVPGWPRYLFSAVAIMAGILIVWLLRRGGDRWYCTGLALILGGALGNLWDRVTLGYVVDFLLFHWRSWSYPAFNLADSAITIGAALVVLDSIGLRRGTGAASN